MALCVARRPERVDARAGRRVVDQRLQTAAARLLPLGARDPPDITAHVAGARLASRSSRRRVCYVRAFQLKLRRELGDRQGEAATRHELASIDLEQGAFASQPNGSSLVPAAASRPPAFARPLCLEGDRADPGAVTIALMHRLGAGLEEVLQMTVVASIASGRATCCDVLPNTS